MSKSSPEAGVEACPVDHATRTAWLKNNSSRPPFPGATPPAKPGPSCDSDTVDQTAPSTQQPAQPSASTAKSPPSHEPAPSSPSTPSSHPANSESETGASPSGNWIYPSEKMFFDAMKRKGYNSDEKDMKTIVPIHNAVNERAWKEIREWERGWGSEKCGGPRLQSFLGLSQTLSPKARINTLLGYTAPFDRHDWVVDRCGTRVDYVIDFYAGRNEGKGDGKLNFYLDVRPKLNTWEGWKMRAWKGLGLS
ncbi:Cytochrome c1 heme lyase [Clarireedia jacksonii]